MSSNPNHDLFDRFGLDLFSEVCSQMDFEDCYSSSSSCSSSSSSSSPSGFSAASRAPGRPSPKRKAGRKKFRETRHPVYHGVRARDGGKWVCEVREPRKKTRIWLGTYTTPESAAIAHDAAAVALRGGSARLNFPLLAPSLPRARSTAPEDVRRAAAEAAAAEMVLRSNPPPAGRKDEAETSASAPPHPTPAFVDEEAVFNMPALLEDMARGLLITPPGMQTGFDWDAAEECCDADTWRLWADDN